MVCPGCGAPIAPDDQFCESCGATVGSPGSVVAEPERIRNESLPTAPVPPAPPPDAATTVRLCSCGGAIDTDGWCTVCGLRAANDRDHTTEQLATNVAAVSDKGRVHTRNEDAFALARAG